MWGKRTGTAPAPVLFILASTIDETLGSGYFRQCGTRLSKENGWLCVSLDLPFHGELHTENGQNNLAEWAAAARRKEDFVASNNARMRSVLDYLVRHGYANDTLVFACGTSRGGYLALQFAAYDQRVKAVAAFAPVTKLTALREFEGMTEEGLLPSFRLNKQLDKLAGRHCWLVIGDRDARVNTDDAVQFARNLSARIAERKEGGSVELNVMPEPRGHTTPPGAADKAVEWFRRQAPDHLPRWDSTARPDIYYSRVELFRSLPHSGKDIVLLGNSITFWGDWNMLLASPRIKNRGIPGDNTFGVLERINEVTEGKPAKVFLLIGINDLAKNIPDSVIVRNYKQIIAQIEKGSPGTKIYFQTLLPTQNILNKRSPIYNNNDRIRKINASIRELGALNKRVVIVDLYPHFADAGGRLKREYTWDGVHLNLAGYKRWAAILEAEKILK